MQKELKHLNRKELIDIIYQLKKSNQELQEENEILKNQLESRRVSLSDVGSIADAAIVIADVFNAAQAAADIYLTEIKLRCEEFEQGDKREKEERITTCFNRKYTPMPRYKIDQRSFDGESQIVQGQ